MNCSAMRLCVSVLRTGPIAAFRKRDGHHDVDGDEDADDHVDDNDDDDDDVMTIMMTTTAMMLTLIGVDPW